MFRPRVIPILLLQDYGLVKTKKFSKPVYLGDPINTIKIFNDFRADEIILLDITATKEKRNVDFNLIKQFTHEAFMPVAVGGGVRDIGTVKKLFESGADKVIINSSLEDQNLLTQAIEQFGSQSIVASIDVKKNLFGKYIVKTHSGTKAQKVKLLDLLQFISALPVGEVMINSIDLDGTMNGYDLELINFVKSHLSCPLIAAGGAGSLNDLKKITLAGANAAAAGSIFVFQDNSRDSVLINYPYKEELTKLFRNEDL